MIFFLRCGAVSIETGRRLTFLLPLKSETCPVVFYCCSVIILHCIQTAVIYYIYLAKIFLHISRMKGNRMVIHLGQDFSLKIYLNDSNAYESLLLSV